MTTTAEPLLIAAGDVEEEEHESAFLQHPAVLTIVAILLISLVLLSVGGNLMVIISYCRDAKLRTVHNFYILNLAVADFLLGLHSLPFYAYFTISNWTWPTNYIHCKVWNVIDFTTSLVAVMMTVVISLDRLILIKTGINYTRKVTWRMAYLQVMVTWLVGFLLYSPAIIGWNYWTGTSIVKPGDCEVEFAFDFPFTLATAILEFGCNFIALSIINLLIYLDIRKRMRISVARNEAMKKALAVGQDTASSCEEVKGQQKISTVTPQREVRKDLKAAKALFVLVAALAVTWAPYTVATIVVSLCEKCVNKAVYEFFNWLLYSKAAINPFLFAYNSVRFRENFARMMRPFCRFCKCCTRCRKQDTPSRAVNDLTVQSIS